MKKNQILPKLINVLLIFSAAIILWLSHPNPIFNNGLGFLGYFIYLPFLLLIRRTSFKNVWLYAGLLGALSYFLLVFWLSKYHFLSLILVCLLYFIIYALLSFLLKFVQNSSSLICLLGQLFILAAYEYIKTLGYLGFSYGVSAYSQWKYSPLIQSSAFGGVFSLNLLLILPSVLLSFILESPVKKEKIKEIPFLCLSGIWVILFAANFIYGEVVLKHAKTAYETCPKIRVLAVQNNESPWKNGLAEHEKNVGSLIALSEQGVSEYPDTAFVVWPETAVAPSIMRHFYAMEDSGRFRLITKLLSYINASNQVFVIGNAHEEIDENQEKKIFNNALVFNPAENVFPPQPLMYTKKHLVPVSESFPFEKIFPRLYARLKKGNTHFWEKGSEYKVFIERGLAFSTPICFEDTFGNECRHFVASGARSFINLSNDSWSESLACQLQHLSMAVFRSAENRVPSVRSTSSGQTCIIDCNGRVTACARPFTQAYVSGKIPVLNEAFKESFYTRHGDVLGKLECLIAILLLIIKGILCIIRKNRGIHG
ncbi:MAG: apolipoprotein N-acyltransferase [Treponema sp.]|nr:apolipoprotein N-acyltransferase [Treponema sp.]